MFHIAAKQNLHQPLDQKQVELLEFKFSQCLVKLAVSEANLGALPTGAHFTVLLYPHDDCAGGPR